MKYAWHVTPKKNIESILKNCLHPSRPEEDGDLAISLFKTLEDVHIQTKLWLSNKFHHQPLVLLKIDITNLSLTETFPFELITTNIHPINVNRIVEVNDFLID